VRLIIGLILAALALVGIVLIGGWVAPFPLSGLAGGVTLGMVAAYLVFSLGTLDFTEVGVLDRFGKPIAELSPGLYFAPVGLYRTRRESRAIFQQELPADPEKIFRGDGSAPEGLFPPIRQKFGPPDPNDTDLAESPYNKEMVAEVVPVVGWQIRPTEAITFFQVVGSVANCRQMLTDLVLKPVVEDLAAMTPAKAQKQLRALNGRIKAELVAEVAGWGIEIKAAYIKQFNYSHSLNSAVEGTSIAEQNAKAVKETAEGERQRLLRTGLAKEATDGTLELVPDAATKAKTDALKELKELRGTLVLGDASTVFDVNKKGEKQ